MKNNKWIWIGMTLVVIALTAVVLGVNAWYNSGGVRVMGNQLRVELEGTGYVFDGETGEVTGQSPVILRGNNLSADKQTFDGTLEVLAYQNEELGTVTGTSVVQEGENGFWMVHYLEQCLHYEDVEDGTEAVEHICDYYYTYFLYPKNPDFLVVLVESFKEDTPIYIVLADSEAEAAEAYTWFMENKPKS